MPESIRQALQECLNRSLNPDVLNPDLDAIYDRLRQAGWSEDQIRTFQTRVLRLLRRLRVNKAA